MWNLVSIIMEYVRMSRSIFENDPFFEIAFSSRSLYWKATLKYSSKCSLAIFLTNSYN